jgi:hypothetical protein
MTKPARRMGQKSPSFILKCAFLLLVAIAPVNSRADTTPVTITVTTSMLAGTPADLAFDFIDGGTPSNTISISAFSTDGVLGSPSITGGASGTLPGPIVLTDSSFFNEYLTGITLNDVFSFTFTATANGPDPTSVPDAFSIFLLDPTSGFPLFTTTDPTESNALFTFDIDGTPQGALSLYQAPGGEVTVSAGSVVPVAEPSSLLLLEFGLAIFVLGFATRRDLRHT